MKKIKDISLTLVGELSSRKQAREYFLECSRKNPKLFNGVIYCVGNIVWNGEVASLDLYKGRYEDFLYNEVSPEKVHPLGVEVLLETKDHFLILCKMAGWTHTAGKYKTIGGNVDNEEGLVHIHPKETAVREIGEELSINCSKDNLHLQYFYSNPEGFTSILYKGFLDQSREEVDNIFTEWKKKDPEQELEALIYLENNPESIKAFLEHKEKQKTNFLEILLREILREKLTKKG